MTASSSSPSGPSSSSSPRTLHELQRKVQAFCKARGWDRPHSLKNLTLGAVTEAAELVEPFRFLTDEQSEAFFATPAGREAVEDELADVLFFLLRIAQRNNVDLAASLDRKLIKNARKYPALGDE